MVRKLRCEPRSVVHCALCAVHAARVEVCVAWRGGGLHDQWRNFHHAGGAGRGWGGIHNNVRASLLSLNARHWLPPFARSRCSPRTLSPSIEKLDRSSSRCDYSTPPPNATTAETATFQLSGSFAAVTQLYAWASDFSSGNPSDGDLFQSLPPIVVQAGAFSIPVKVGQLFTLSTLSTGRHGAAATPPPPSAPFPLPYADTFSSDPAYAPGKMPRFWSNINGAFELADSGTSRGLVLQLRTRGKPVLWVVDSSRPVTVVGDVAWEEVQVAIDFSLQSAGSGVVLGLRCSGDQDLLPGIMLSLSEAGAWNITNSLFNIGKNSSDVAASGFIPGGVQAGTWHTLYAKVRGGNATFLLDGAPLVMDLDVTKGGFPSAGWWALGGLSWDDEVFFSNATASLLPDLCSQAPAPFGTNLTLRACDAGNKNKAFSFVPAAPGGAVGSLRPASNPSACIQRTPSTLVSLAACSDTAAQQWTMVRNATAMATPGLNQDDSGLLRFVNGQDGTCLETVGQNTAPSTAVDSWACHYGSNPIDTNQLWRFETSTGALTSALSGLCAAACVVGAGGTAGL